MSDTTNHEEEISDDAYATLVRHQFKLKCLGDRLQRIENATATMKDKWRIGDKAMRDFTSTWRRYLTASTTEWRTRTNFMKDGDSEMETDKETPEGASTARPTKRPQLYVEPPFADDITLVEMPRKFSFPNIRMYDSTNDPDDHVAQYKQHMLTVAIQIELREANMWKGFGSTLTGPTLQWQDTGLQVPARRRPGSLLGSIPEVQSLKKKLDEYSKQLEESAEKLNQLESENLTLRDKNQALNTTSNKKRHFRTQVRTNPTLKTPNSAGDTTRPPTTSNERGAVHEKAKGTQTYDVEDRESNPELDKEVSKGGTTKKSPMTAYLEQMFSKRMTPCNPWWKDSQGTPKGVTRSYYVQGIQLNPDRTRLEMVYQRTDEVDKGPSEAASVDTDQIPSNDTAYAILNDISKPTSIEVTTSHSIDTGRVSEQKEFDVCGNLRDGDTTTWCQKIQSAQQMLLTAICKASSTPYC
ncbi:hypothetical protein F2Q70_00011861 [Brassica cretica]|uniref:Uncharacterized protein n=1 Tax=Brassica cretica TaxID=69181 RepID=A0A8S9M6Q3_BRACR|nr:hypothetical protein F2Q70_00011861 [Brassica cretica]